MVYFSGADTSMEDASLDSEDRKLTEYEIFQSLQVNIFKEKCYRETILICWKCIPPIIIEKGITTLRIYQCWISRHSVNETCFELLKSSDYDATQVINPQNFKIVLKFSSWSPNFNLLFIPYIIHPLTLPIMS